MASNSACVALAAAAILVAGCDGPGFGERDQFVVHTPVYSDNRVFFVAPVADSAGGLALERPTSERSVSPLAAMVHGRPLSLVLGTVSLPKAATGFSGVRDIAVIVDLASAADGSGRSLVAWYQRGVRPDQNLNFSNLLLFHEAAWDDRVAPLVRIRVMDVTVERNLEIRAALNEVAKFQGVVGAAIPNPIVNPIFEVATKAASLILAGRSNQMLLDYTAQFYSSDQVETAFGSDLTPLQKGRFILIGRKDGDRSYWKRQFRFDPMELNVVDLTTNTGVPSPFVLVSISDIEAVVPSSVAARSAYLQKMLGDAQNRNYERAQEEAKFLKSGVDALAAYEKLRRFRSTAALLEAYRVAVETPDADLSATDRAMLIGTFAAISGCNLTSKQELARWWGNGGSTQTFEDGKFRLKSFGTGC